MPLLGGAALSCVPRAVQALCLCQKWGKLYEETNAKGGSSDVAQECYEAKIGPSGAVQTVSSKRAVGHYFW